MRSGGDKTPDCLIGDGADVGKRKWGLGLSELGVDIVEDRSCVECCAALFMVDLHDQRLAMTNRSARLASIRPVNPCIRINQPLVQAKSDGE
jgi:hypothetical protein